MDGLDRYVSGGETNGDDYDDLVAPAGVDAYLFLGPLTADSDLSAADTKLTA